MSDGDDDRRPCAPATSSLYVESTGAGHPIVFVHEFASDHREWEPQVRWFSRSYRCITYNARGYPPSDVPDDPEQYGWELAVADLLAVLDGLDDPRRPPRRAEHGRVRRAAVRAGSTPSGSAPSSPRRPGRARARPSARRGRPSPRRSPRASSPGAWTAMADEIGNGADAHPAAAQEPAGVAGVHGPPRASTRRAGWPTRWPATRRCGRRCTTSRSVRGDDDAGAARRSATRTRRAWRRT